MNRKLRTTVSEELYKCIVNTLENSCHSTKEIAEIHGVNIKTIQRIATNHKLGKPFKKSDEKAKKTWSEKREVNTVSDNVVFTALSCNNSLTQGELKEKLADQNMIMSQPTISRVISKIGFSRKRLSLVPAERNTVEKLSARALYATELSRIPDENSIFLDETGFNEHTRRSYGYSPVNSKAYITVPANKNVNRSLICAIGMEGVIEYSYKTGSFNSNSFIEFVEDKLVPYFNNNPGKILVMDNARIHKSVSVSEVLRSKNITCKFLVPYSPELNPIEEFFQW